MLEDNFGLVKAARESWSPSILWPMLLSIVLSVLALSHYYRSWKRLAHIPGPSAAHISILWLLRHAWRGNLFPCMIRAGEQYGESPEPSVYTLCYCTDYRHLQGPLTRIGPNLLLCSDPDALRAISGVRSEYTKGPAYDAGRVTEGDPHVASERDPVKHKALRAKMGPAVSYSAPEAILHQHLGSDSCMLCLISTVLPRRTTCYRSPDLQAD